MADVCLRSHEDISGGRETVPVTVHGSVCLLDRGLLDFVVLILCGYHEFVQHAGSDFGAGADFT